jgi:hypothetical protein
MRHFTLLGLVVLLAGPLAAQERTTSPHGDLKTECTVCHQSSSWTAIQVSKQFNHASYGFPLTGAHGATTCRGCHVSLNFKNTSASCASCHTDNHRGEFGANCARCHTTRAFTDRDEMAKAHQLTRFPLSGSHLSTDCTACHKPSPQGQMQFIGTPTACASCHQQNYNTAPNHVASNFPTTCESCHSTTSWNAANLGAANHPVTPIALTGVHSGNLIACTTCHTTMPYSTVQSTCVACHQAAYNGAKDPDHVAGNFSTTCTECHGLVAGWLGAKFNHPTSPVALTGAHSPNLVSCSQCHTTMPYSTVKQTCDGCHHAEYVATTTPSHTAAGYGTDCASCHQVVANWAGAVFNHPTAPIALTGAHSTNLVTCNQCHTTTPYSTVKTTCDGCHHAEYLATSNPSHTASGYGTDCASCHQVVAGWTGAVFNHPTAPIALTGVHSANLLTCAQCHTTTPYSTVQTTCDGCHHTDYVGAKDPDHVAGNFSTTCTTCHSMTAGWLGATFNHPTSPIALTGAHSANLVNCSQCHTTMPYSTVKQTCDGCHHADYVATTNPSHTAAGYSTDCASCHQVVANWTGATFNHPTSPIALTGVHSTTAVQCTQCHTTMPYSTVKQTCDGCHHADFVAPVDPNHVAANFSVNCTDCHGLVANWANAKFLAHDGSISQFRIYSGKHLGKWSQCQECHRLGQPYASTPSLLCLNCHAQVQTDTHRGKNYTPSDCVRSGCHANGSTP